MTKEEKAKQAWEQWEEQIRNKDRQMNEQEEQKSNYIQQIARQRQKQLAQVSNVYSVKRQIAAKNQEQTHRQKSYEA